MTDPTCHDIDAMILADPDLFSEDEVEGALCRLSEGYTAAGFDAR